MDRTETLIAVMVLLFGAFLLGFLTHWIVTRLSHVSDAELGQLDSMAAELHRAEEERDAAIAHQHRYEHEQGVELEATREAYRHAQAELEELRAYLEAQNQRAQF